MNRLEQMLFDLEFNSHKMSIGTFKNTIESAIEELDDSEGAKYLISRLKYLHVVSSNKNYNKVIDEMEVK